MHVAKLFVRLLGYDRPDYVFILYHRPHKYTVLTVEIRSFRVNYTVLRVKVSNLESIRSSKIESIQSSNVN